MGKLEPAAFARYVLCVVALTLTNHYGHLRHPGPQGWTASILIGLALGSLAATAVQLQIRRRR